MRQLATLVGMQHRKSERLVASLSAGTALTLRRDPENPHDPNAVAVYLGPTHIAFIKATEAVSLARQMDAAGQKEITGVYRVTGERWPQVEVDSR